MTEQQPEITDKLIEFDGTPYFVHERTEKGIFYVAKAIAVVRDGYYAQHQDGMEDLVLGRDIIETPLEGLQLLIDTTESYLPNIFEMLRRFAVIAGHEYVALENERRLRTRHDGKLTGVTPRLFKINPNK